MLFVAIVPAATFGTPTAQQSGNFNVSVAGTAVDSIPHQIDLKEQHGIMILELVRLLHDEPKSTKDF